MEWIWCGGGPAHLEQLHIQITSAAPKLSM